MIVERGQFGLILSGRRTQTRRPVDGREQYYRIRAGRRGQSHSLVKPYEPRVGDRILIERPDGGAEHAAPLHVVVTAVEQQTHNKMTRADVLACGYQTVAGYQAAWVREHDRDWVGRERPRQAIRAAADGLGIVLAEHLIRSRLAHHRGDADRAIEAIRDAHQAGTLAGATPRDPDAPPVLPTLTAADLAARFQARHADKLVWVIDHQVATDEPLRLLAARPGSVQADYVTSTAQAMGGESDPGEAVDPDTIAKLGAAAALRQEQQVVAGWLRLRRSLEQQIRELESTVDLLPAQTLLLARLRHQLEGGDKRFAA